MYLLVGPERFELSSFCLRDRYNSHYTTDPLSRRKSSLHIRHHRFSERGLFGQCLSYLICFKFFLVVGEGIEPSLTACPANIEDISLVVLPVILSHEIWWTHSELNRILNGASVAYHPPILWAHAIFLAVLSGIEPD